MNTNGKGETMGNRNNKATLSREMKAERKIREERRRAFLARRDAEYAAHTGQGGPETVKVGDGRRVVTRGRISGSSAGVHTTALVPALYAPNSARRKKMNLPRSNPRGFVA